MFGTWRLILAFEVFVFHVVGIPVIGRYAVISFFVLSGFLMTAIMHQSYGYCAKGLGAFAANRALRLYPNMWFACLVTLLGIAWFGEAESYGFLKALSYPATWQEWAQNFSLIFASFKPWTV